MAKPETVQIMTLLGEKTPIEMALEIIDLRKRLAADGTAKSVGLLDYLISIGIGTNLNDIDAAVMRAVSKDRSRAEAARMLGLPERTFYRKARELGIPMRTEQVRNNVIGLVGFIGGSIVAQILLRVSQ